MANNTKSNSNKSKKPSGSKSGPSKPKIPFSTSFYNEIINNLSIIFLYKKTIDLLKSDDTFRQTIEYYVNAINTYEKSKKVKDAKTSDFSTAFKTITSKDIDLKKLTKDEIEEIEDKLNFLPIYVKNSIGEDWSSIVESFKLNKSDLDSIDSTNLNNTESTESGQAYTKPFDAEEFMRKNNISMNQIADSVIAQQANVLLRNDILQNKFFQYNSRPSFFVWIKWALFVAWILCSILFLVNSFSTITLGEGSYVYFFQQVSIQPDVEINHSDIAGKYFRIDNILAMGIFNVIISILIPAIIAYYAYVQVKNIKNDNFKFSCKTFITWVLLIYLISSIFILMKQSQSNIFDFKSLKNGLGVTGLPTSITINWTNNNGGSESVVRYIDQYKLYPVIMTQYVSSIMIYVTVGISTILSLIIIVVRPKLDISRMEAKINEYINDIKSGKISISDSIVDGKFGSGMFGGGRSPFSPF